MDHSQVNLPSSSKLRKASPSERRELVAEAIKNVSSPWAMEALHSLHANQYFDDMADIMVEQALGTFPIPMGLASGFLINGKEYLLPMVTEEPSVIAAASYAGTKIARHGGFSTWSTAPIMTGTVYLTNEAGNTNDALASLEESRPRLLETLAPMLMGMVRRGGGLVSMDFTALDPNTIKVTVNINVCDAMGANIINSCMESLRKPLEVSTGWTVLMAILSNRSVERQAGASFSVPVSALARGPYTGEEIAQRLIAAWKVAQLDEDRACTHNKGIMNGMVALGLATGNDTRAMEAAAHCWASHHGKYGPLTNYKLETIQGLTNLVGSIQFPLALGTIGGAMGVHPLAQVSLNLLGNPSAQTLAEISMSLGLAQNFAALWALVSEGIQGGHMRLHARRLAWQAGARGRRIDLVATMLSQKELYNLEAARDCLNQIDE